MIIKLEKEVQDNQKESEQFKKQVDDLKIKIKAQMEKHLCDMKCQHDHTSGLMKRRITETKIHGDKAIEKVIETLKAEHAIEIEEL